MLLSAGERTFLPLNYNMCKEKWLKSVCLWTGPLRCLQPSVEAFWSSTRECKIRRDAPLATVAALVIAADLQELKVEMRARILFSPCWRTGRRCWRHAPCQSRPEKTSVERRGDLDDGGTRASK